MGILGMTEHIKSSYASLFETVHLSPSNGAILVIDQTAFKNHVLGLMSASPHDGSAARAFSFTCTYLTTLASSGVKSMHFVNDGLLPNSYAAMVRNEDGVTKAAEYVQAPTGEEIGDNHTLIAGNVSGFEDALLWFSTNNPSVPVVKLRSDGEAGFLTASTASTLQAQNPKKKVFILSK
jgi:hypothetical protein